MFQSLLWTDELDFTRKSRCKRAAWGGESAYAHTLGQKQSKSQGGKEMAGSFPVPLSLPHCSKDVKTCFRWKLSSASPKYLLLPTKTRRNLVPQMSPKKQSSPGSYSCKSKITAVERVKNVQGRRDSQDCISCSERNKVQADVLNDSKPSLSKAAHRVWGFNRCHRVLCSCS